MRLERFRIMQMCASQRRRLCRKGSCASRTSSSSLITPGISLKDAASFPEVACTVWSTIFMIGRAGYLPIHGDSSGIGTFAIQIAKYRGARLFITEGSEEKLAACTDLGADVCINYKTEDFVARVKEEKGGKVAGLQYRCPENKAVIVREVEDNVWPAIVAGKVKTVVYKRIPLSKAAEASPALGN